MTMNGPWSVISIGPDEGWMVVHAKGVGMSMWRATREIAQELADDENRRWRQQQVELAAPDMLEALVAAERVTNWKMAVHAADLRLAAIAKAMGEP